MRTCELINAIAEDRVTPPAPGRALGFALLAGTAFAAFTFGLTLGLRPHLLSHISADPRVGFKVALCVLLATVSGVVLLRLFRPDRSWRAAALLLAAPPALLSGAVAIELMALDPARWMPSMIGHNAMVCVTAIPLFAAAPLAAVLTALRGGAPERPAVAGAGAGLLAGAIGASLYAMHCPDDSPLFVAVWYSLAILAVAGLGAVVGGRLLRW